MIFVIVSEIHNLCVGVDSIYLGNFSTTKMQEYCSLYFMLTDITEDKHSYDADHYVENTFC
jgi:hypothetical protein